MCWSPKNQRFSDAVDESLNILQERFPGKVSILVVDSADPVLTAKNIVRSDPGRNEEVAGNEC